MAECCNRDAYRDIFGDRFARRIASQYQQKGLDSTRRRIVEFLAEGGLRDATVLEVGGGVGELQIELLRRGIAAQTTNLELSEEYESHSAGLLTHYGLSSKVSRAFVDIATNPEDVPAADIVVLHRVVCCYPDYGRLLTAAADHARRLLVFSHPPRNPISRLIVGTGNFACGLRGKAFRSYVHPPEAMLATAESRGFTLKYRQRSMAWTVLGLERN
jgi:magnesium-protoporphyrin O-methyltransferase